MCKDWDTIVVGAGIGGLTAAANLVKAGLGVLVLDRNPHPGGTAYVYHRKGFSFPMGPLGFSDPKIVQDTLRDLKVGEDLELSRVHYRIRARDLDIPLSLPYSEMVRELIKTFPSDSAGIREFFKVVAELTSSPNLPPSNSDQPRVKRSSDISASDYLLTFIKDRRLRRILGSMGTREPYSSLSLLAAMWNLMCQEGIWYPREGMQSFCDRLVKAVKMQEVGNKKGVGEIRLSTEVKKIRIEKGKTLGVILADGTEIGSATIISNADYKNTFLKLIEPELVPPEYYQSVCNSRQTGSIFQICLGIDKGRADLSVFEKASRLIYRQNIENAEEGDLNWDVAEIDPEVFATQELEVSLWEKEDGITSPTGRAVIVIRTEAEYSHFSKYRTASGGRSAGYQGYKTRLARRLIHEVETLIPGIANAILVMDVATPLTFEDQGGRSQGAVAGWSWDYEDFRDEKPRELIRTPIKGLYMAGYQAFSALFMGGIPTAMESGKRAARAVHQGTGPTEKIFIPGVS